MAVTVTNNMTTETNAGADATTGWTASDGPVQYTTFFRESNACLGMGGSTSDEDAYITITSADFSGRTLFGWMLNGSPGSTANIGFGLLLGDGTNDRVYAVGGNDNYGHFVNGWSGFRLDGSVLPTTTRNITGAGAPTLTTITRIGYGMNYSIGAFGKVDNMFYDMLRWIANGSAALSISGGTTGDRGTWDEIRLDDESTADGKAYGVCRLLSSGSKAYELTYGIEFGAATGDTYFQDSGFQLILNGENMSAGNMDVDLVAGTGTNVFILEDAVIAGVGTVSNWDLSAAFETMQFNGMTVSNLGTITFPSSGGTLRESLNCSFNNCGIVNIGTNFTLTNPTFNGTTDANGALEFDTDTDDTNVSGAVFISDGTGHAIHINIDTASATTFDIDSFTVDGYAGQDGTAGNRVFLITNPSDGDITINISASTILNKQGTGEGFSYELAAGTTSTVTVNNNVTGTFTNLKDNSEIRIYDAGTGVELAGIEDATSGSPDARTFAASIAAATSVNYVIHNFQPGDEIYQTIRVNGFTWPSTNQDILINQVIDRNAEN
jgi:hypothetical protein